MSKIFIENGQEGSKNLFNKKQLYKIVSRSNMKNLIDFNSLLKISKNHLGLDFQESELDSRNNYRGRFNA